MTTPTPEFSLIARYFTRATPGAIIGVGDDCAVLSISPGHELVVSTDSLVAGAHFFANTDPGNLGHKALAVNLSDLAAMGATPRWCTLALTIPKIDHPWLAAFSAGFFSLADAVGIELVGGDTTHGPLSITVTVLGQLTSGKALRRNGANAGDDVWVSGTLGDAALALRMLRGQIVLAEPQSKIAISRLERPMPRLMLGLELHGIATSAIDISDGLAADLGHICERSNLGARLELASLPTSSTMKEQVTAVRIECQLAGGDDYELCFTAAPSSRPKIEDLSIVLGLPLTRVGKMMVGQGVSIVDAQGLNVHLDKFGFDHFAQS